MERQLEYVLRTVEERGVRFVRLWFTDVLGFLKSVEITPAEAAVARMFCDIQTFSGDPFDGDPRYVLKRNLERAREKGFTFFVGPEMEFFYFRTGKKIEPLDDAGYFDLTAHDLG